MTEDKSKQPASDTEQASDSSKNSPSLSMLHIVMAETLGMSMHNAVSAQQNAQMLNSAITTSTCARILSVIGEKMPAPAAHHERKNTSAAKEEPEHMHVAHTDKPGKTKPHSK